MRQERSYGVVLVGSVLVGCLEVALGVVVVVLYAHTQPPPAEPVDYAFLVPFSTLVAVLAFVLTVVFVLPAVWVGDLVERRGGGRWAWWAPVVVAALVAVPVGVFGAYNDGMTGPLLAFWGAATGMLSLGALTAGIRRSGLLRRIAVWGVAVVAGTGLLGALGLAAGVFG